VSEAESIPLRVQVIDMRPRTLDLVVPTYLPARDLTQRVARDAGLQAYWPDGRRRRFWIRARGRVVGDDERLSDVGVIANELVHLLPEPPNNEVEEQYPDYPETHDYPASGTLAILGGVVSLLLWSAGWGVALSAGPGILGVVLPGLGLGLLSCSVARHVLGGEGGRLSIAAVGLIVSVLMLVPAALVPILSGLPVEVVMPKLLPGGLVSVLGVVIGWLAWWGPVEPLPARAPKAQQDAAQQEAQTVPCAICGMPATMDVAVGCPHSCGRAFHKGCYQARMAVAHEDASRCTICGTGVGG